MKRENYNNNGTIREYKNGNITIKYTPDGITESKEDDVLTISDLLSYIDCEFISETYSLNNYETGHTVYNYYSDLIYVFPWKALQDLEQGKTIRLYARKPDKWDRELIEQEEY